MSEPDIDKSYSVRIVFYLTVLALPLIIMTMVVLLAPGSAASPMSPDPSRFLFFVLYFLPGLVVARIMTQSWRKTLGVGVAYLFIAPAYYYYAVYYACQIAGTCAAA